MNNLSDFIEKYYGWICTVIFFFGIGVLVGLVIGGVK